MRHHKRLFRVAFLPVLGALALAACGGGTGVVPSITPDNHGKHIGSVPSPAPTSTVSPTASPSAAPTSSPSPKPTASASPAATASPSATSVATYAGCPVFAAGDYYNADVSTAPIDANSAAYLGSMWGAGDTGTFVEAPEQVVNVASSSTPMVQPVSTSYHTPIAEPWQSGFAIEPTGDAHAVVLNTQTCEEYESYGTSWNGSSLSVYSNGGWNLTKPYQMQPVISMASGLSLFAGMVKWNEIQAGHINHELNWVTKYNTASYGAYVAPATSTDHIAFNGSGTPMPYGAHLRLRANYDESTLSAQGKVLAEALKHYGMYLSDTGYTNKLFFEKPPAGQSYNVGSLLNGLTIQDFDVVDFTP